jgi:two-component system, NtrC family, nitrogen regulation response regulator GlnG
VNNTAPILIVDDEPSICWGFQRLLRDEGITVLTAGTAEEGLRIAEESQPALIVLDVRLPGQDGLSAMPEFRRVTSDTPIVVITAFGDLETAVKAVHQGAADYLTKPFRIEEVWRVIKGVLEKNNALDTARTSVQSAPQPDVGSLVGSSPAMQQLYRQIAMVADSDLSVLITGETGTGKELIASAIHRHSHRREGPYLPIAPVALNPALIESELFGHVRGAFTGATQDREGLFALARGGTILLDEIGDLPVAVQVKLLRVLEQRQYTPVGDVRPRDCDVRILAATNIDLKAACQRGDFREDLYYRLAAVEIQAPSLRDHLEDIESLALHFLRRTGAASHELLPIEVVNELKSRAWYGNVRELRNAIEHAAVLSRGRPIRIEHLPAPIPRRVEQSSNADIDLADVVRSWAQQALHSGTTENLSDRFLKEVEPTLYEVALQARGGNRAAAADLLGIHRGTLRDRMRKYGMDPDNPS